MHVERCEDILEQYFLVPGRSLGARHFNSSAQRFPRSCKQKKIRSLVSKQGELFLHSFAELHQSVIGQFGEAADGEQDRPVRAFVTWKLPPRTPFASKLVGLLKI